MFAIDGKDYFTMAEIREMTGLNYDVVVKLINDKMIKFSKPPNNKNTFGVDAEYIPEIIEKFSIYALNWSMLSSVYRDDGLVFQRTYIVDYLMRFGASSIILGKFLNRDHSTISVMKQEARYVLAQTKYKHFLDFLQNSHKEIREKFQDFVAENYEQDKIHGASIQINTAIVLLNKIDNYQTKELSSKLSEINKLLKKLRVDDETRV